jgi:hypothetical protein
MKIKSFEGHNVDVAAAGEKHLKDFDDELVKDLVELRTLYIRNTNHIRGLCSSMLEGEPSTVDYIRWLLTEVTGVPEMLPVLVEISFLSRLRVLS